MTVHGKINDRAKFMPFKLLHLYFIEIKTEKGPRDNGTIYS
jgi:hypothetical protein